MFLTHVHEDHTGFLNELLQQQRNIWVIASEKALPGLSGGRIPLKAAAPDGAGVLFVDEGSPSGSPR